VGGDDDPGSAGCHDRSEDLEYQGGAVEIDGQDRFRRSLGWRHAGGMDEAGDITEGRGFPGEGDDIASL
jgi:hypothetical protein